MVVRKTSLALLFWIVVFAGAGIFVLRNLKKPESATSNVQAKVDAQQKSPTGFDRAAKRNFDSTAICSDAMQPYQVIDHSDDTDLDHFDVPLQEGCFGKLILLPKTWYRWRNEDANQDDPTGWVSFLIENQAAEPPNGMNRDVPVTANHSFRVQGKGTVRILKSD